MRYAIGARIVNKNGEKIDGLFAVGSYGTSIILRADCDEKVSQKYTLPIFEDLECAKKYVNQCSHNYRSTFKANAKKRGVDRDSFGFYLVRFDVPKYSFIALREGNFGHFVDPKYPDKKNYYFTIKR